MATSKYLTGTISGLLFVTKIYEISNQNFQIVIWAVWGRGIGVPGSNNIFVFVIENFVLVTVNFKREIILPNIWDRRHIF